MTMVFAGTRNGRRTITTIVGMMVLVAMMFVDRIAAAGAPHPDGLLVFPRSDVPWGYEGKLGPAHWGDLDPKYELCRTGSSQSPRNIDDWGPAPKPHLDIRWGVDTNMTLVNNGHTINLYSSSTSRSYIGWNSDVYSLVEFHMHSPSEHHFDSRFYPLEVHFVHQSVKTKNYLVVGTIFESSPQINPFFEQFVDKISQEVGTKVDSIAVDFNMLGLTSNDLSQYYSYSGSFTVPPCEEDVQWIVLKNIRYIAAQQIIKIRSIMPYNARGTQ